MTSQGLRCIKEAKVGDSVSVYLSEVDRGRCEFPNVLACIVEILENGMYKLHEINLRHYQTITLELIMLILQRSVL